MLIEGVLVEDTTLFSSEWGQFQVIDKVIEAAKNIIENETSIFRDGSKEIFGLTSDGMKIEMYITKDRVLHSVYPTFKGK